MGGALPLTRSMRIACLLATVACSAPSVNAAEAPPWLPISQDPPLDVRCARWTATAAAE
jgi:hypothetical protein